MKQFTEKTDTNEPNSPPLEGCPKGGVVKRNTKNYFSLPYNPKLKERAKALRKAGNLAEVTIRPYPTHHCTTLKYRHTPHPSPHTQ